MQIVDKALIYPVISMIGLVFIVWIGVYFTRIRAFVRGEVTMDSFARHEQQSGLPQYVILLGENFTNQFELPVLFYLLVVLIYLSNLNIDPYVGLAWGFVLFRVAHTLVHTTYNIVLHRLLTYWIGAIFLWVMWAMYIAEFI